MNFIEQHSDPKIRKLGIKWALYREPKPDKRDYYPDPDGRYFDEASYNRDLKYHLESRIAYLKEPEFKKGSIVYYKDKPIHSWYTKLKLGKRYNKLSWRFNALDGFKGFGIIEETKITHYCPGQQVESFKYVREETNAINLLGLQELYGDEIPDSHLWQEEEEPEPMLVGKTKYHEPTYEPNPEYAQFQEDVDSGKILAEI